jgi:signal transduction histidine kinase
MRSSWSLRARFLLATSLLTLVLCTVFALAVHQFIELLEDELLHHTLVREMQQLKTELVADPQARPPAATGLTGFIVHTPGERAALPGELQSLTDGVHEDVQFRGRNYYVAVDKARGAGLYVLLDTERVEDLEDSVVTAALLVGLITLGLAAVIGVALSRAVMRPVTELADDVAHLDPASRNQRLGKDFANHEVGVIAAAFDDFMERLDSVLEREKAFTEDASHELRTPLAIIASSAELLADDPELSNTARERVLRMRRAAGQMQSLIEALLFLARGESGGSPQPCALDQIVKEAVEVIAAGAAAKSLQLNVEVEPVTVPGSPVMVACVVNNLLLNAVNFTQAGTIDVKLTLQELLVRDTGIGIPPSDLSRIFERRYRGAHSRGLGLGLYLVNRICQRLGWSIETSSTEGSGTTFRILLRAAPVAPHSLCTVK